MKPVMAVMVLVMAVMACGVQYADQLPSPTAPAGTPTEKMRIAIITLTPPQNTIVTATEGVRLRDRPDAAGPVDSIELAVMHAGEAFQVESCQAVAGNWWAFGTYQGIKGWANADFLSPNPCRS